MSRGAKVLVGIGLALLLAAAATGWRTYRFVSTGRRALGVVVRESPDVSGDRSPGHPLIAFTTADGRTVRARQHAGADVRYGTRLPVVYPPADPQAAVMADVWSLWVVPVVLGWNGAILSVGPFFGLRPYLKGRGRD